MARTRSMTRNQNHDDEEASSSKKRPTTCTPWSDLDHDLLFLVMMRLGVVDFLFFSGVCKSWRSLAFSNRDTFMASTPPMSVTVITTNADDKECYFEDFEGRKFKTILPDFTGGNCIGLTCGYLVFFMRKTGEFRLVNPITRHQLHFPDSPSGYHPERAAVVFSSSISKWAFVVLYKFSYMRLGGPQPEFTPLKVKQPDCASPNELVSSSDNFYGICWYQDYQNSLYELDLGEMKWVKVCEKRIGEYAFFSSELNRDVVAVKRESWADRRSHERYADTHSNGKIRLNTAHMWYFPHECLNVDQIDE